MRAVWVEKPHNSIRNAAVTLRNSWKASRLGPTGKTQYYSEPVVDVLGIQTRMQSYLSDCSQGALRDCLAFSFGLPRSLCPVYPSLGSQPFRSVPCHKDSPISDRYFSPLSQQGPFAVGPQSVIVTAGHQSIRELPSYPSLHN